MPVQAVRSIRKMRGGAQAHLLLADNGRYYVVKFKNNPQHRRILVNEWIARGGSAVGVRAGAAYVDVGTLHGYRAAIELLQTQPGCP